MRKLALLPVALLAAAGLSTAALLTRPPAPPPPAAAPEEPSVDEGAALTASKGLAWRDGPTLLLRMKTGEVLTLTDRSQCGDLPCPKPLVSQFRYLGWDATDGGYRLTVTPSSAPAMVLPYGDDPMLVDARHVETPPDGPLAQPAPPPPATQDESLAEWISDIAAGRSQSEAPLIKAAKGRVGRDGNQLSLTLGDGRHLVLTDDLSCGQFSCPPQVFRSFDYAGTSPDGRFYVVAERWDEASAAMLVEAATGSITSLLGLPKFSPDGKRAVATVTDLEWSAPRRLEVWVLTGQAPGVEFQLAAKDEDDSVYETVGWTDSEHVRLRRGPWGTDQRNEVMLAFGNGGWHVEGGN